MCAACTRQIGARLRIQMQNTTLLTEEQPKSGTAADLLRIFLKLPTLGEPDGKLVDEVVAGFREPAHYKDTRTAYL